MFRNRLMGIMVAVLLGAGLSMPVMADAHKEEAPKAPAGQEKMERGPQGPGAGRKPGMRGPRRPRPTKEQMVEMTAKRYGVDQAELMALVNNGTQAFDLNLICNMSKLSGKTLVEVAELRKTMTHGRIEVALGLTPEIVAAKQQQQQAEALARDSVVNKAVAEKLLAKGYNQADIRYANAVAVCGGKKLEAVLKLKNANNKWEEVAKKVGVADEDFKTISEKNREGRERREGPGFSGIHYKKMDAELVGKVFHDNYKFDKQEIAQYFEKGMSYGDLELMCLYAYLAKQPLNKVMAMRDKMTVGQIRVKLGLTPMKYREGVIEYQARRLNERFDIPKELTRDYLKKGYAMHHINLSYILAPMCGKSMDEVLAAKIPSKSWAVVAEELGLSKQQYREATGKIWYAFQKKYEE